MPGTTALLRSAASARKKIQAQQDAEIVEPAHHALQLDAIHQEDGERGLGLPHAVEEGVLQVLFLRASFEVTQSYAVTNSTSMSNHDT